ncbi:DHH family phosphoesterase [Halanaerobacter jeridensis]|nr:bifunctional oligoribonuclease/PAP phosphatase NrnA [Halanaerobacter jeridensis]
MNKNNDLDSIINIIENNDRFLVTSHVNPDGDNIGSILALKIFLEQLGKKVEVVLDDEVPDCFSFLSYSQDIKEYNPELEIDFDVLFTLDSGDWERISDVADLVDKQVIVNIDHHADNTLYGDYNLVTDAAATAELIYQLIIELDKSKLNQDLATAIATALITDTGSFRYSNTRPETHQIMADLLDFDVDVNYITRQIFENNTYQSLMLKAKVLETLEVDETAKIAWVKIPEHFLEEVGATWEDAEGIVGYPRSLQGVEVAVLFKEYRPQEIKVSLRSNEYFAVDKVAHQFDGGGHAKAAGCLLECGLEEAEEKVIEAVKEEIRKY